MHSLEPFLLLLSSVFVPLFSVMLGRLAFGVRTADLLAQAPRAHALPIALWLAGIAFFHLVPRCAPVLGSALPTLVLCFVLAYAARARVQSGAHVVKAGVWGLHRGFETLRSLLQCSGIARFQPFLLLKK